MEKNIPLASDKCSIGGGFISWLTPFPISYSTLSRSLHLRCVCEHLRHFVSSSTPSFAGIMKKICPSNITDSTKMQTATSLIGGDGGGFNVMSFSALSQTFTIADAIRASLLMTSSSGGVSGGCLGGPRF